MITKLTEINRSKKIIRAMVAVLGSCLLLGSCGISDDKEPRALPSQDVPFGLLDKEAVTTTTTDAALPTPQGTQRASIFLVVNNERLFEVVKNVQSPGGVRQSLQALFTELSAEELAQGLNTNIDSGTRLLEVTGPTEEGLVTLDLSENLSGTVKERLRLALAQIVYTATAAQGVQSVRFKIGGELSEVPDGTGAATSRPLTRADYAQFAPANSP